MPPRNFNDLFAEWVKTHHKWDIKKSWTGFVPGIVPALSFAVQCFTEPGDEVIVQPPVYYPFFNVIKNNHRTLVYNELVEVDGQFTMDFDALEKQISPRTRMLILCNPHNPGGKVWSRETLAKLHDICLKNKILVISDEVHADMVLKGHQHIPFATVSEEAAQNSVTFMAPSKVFNMPGLISSSFIIPNREIYLKFTDFLEASEMNSGNLFAYAATVACYENGEEWRLQMLDYVQDNINYVIDFLKENIPAIKPMNPEASFLIWLDCKELGMETDELHQFFALKAGLGLNKGTIFGPGGEYHLRLNVACSRKVLEQAMNQLKSALDGR
jgi:cystathionine beta-lyase